VEPRREVVRVGKLRPGIYEAKESGEDMKERQEEPVKVGKVRNLFAEAGGDKEASTPVVLRGARRVNKGNRISCLIENLHTDKKPEDSDEETEADKEEEIKLGRDRMSRIQNMFSGVIEGEEEDKLVGSQSCTDFAELRDEGLVSSNLQRFATGNLRKTSQESTGRKASIETNYIDRKHIESVASKFEDSTSSNQEPNLEKGRPRRLRDTEDLFQHNKEDYTDCVRTEMKVGKLSKDVFKPTPESSKEDKMEIKVGKISTKDLFAQAEANSEELLREVRVGKLSQDRLTLSSSTDLDNLEKTDPDTNVAPTGGVQEKANVFSNTKSKSPPRLSCPKIKRSESSAADDMQKKYEQQMAALKRGQSSSPSVVVRKERGIRKESILKVEPSSSPKQETKVEEKNRVGEQRVLSVWSPETEWTAKDAEKPKVESGKMKAARADFFSSMIAASSAPTSATSSVQRLGTSIMPTVSADDCDKFARIEQEKQANGGKSRGKALFQRMAEKENEKEMENGEEEEIKMLPVELLPGVDMDEMRMTAMMRKPADILPGVDLEEIEDEFEALHRQMMEEAR